MNSDSRLMNFKKNQENLCFGFTKKKEDVNLSLLLKDILFKFYLKGFYL